MKITINLGLITRAGFVVFIIASNVMLHERIRELEGQVSKLQEHLA